MACETMRAPQQTVAERIEQIKRAIADLEKKLAAGIVKPVVGKQGAIAFAGWEGPERAGITDACAYRRISVSGSAAAKAALSRAEQVAGRGVDRRVIGHGVHSHDGGATWHKGH